MKIYGNIDSGNCLKVKYVCDFLQIPYQWIEVDVLKQETRTPGFLQMNPSGQIPVVDLGDAKYLSQSNAIIRYLAQGTSLIPSKPFEQAKMDEWLFWEQYSHEPALAVLRFKRFFLKLEVGAIDPNLFEKCEWALKIMDVHLAKFNFFVGNSMSLADLALFPYTHLAPQAQIDLSPFQNVQQWLNDCKKTLQI